MDDDALRCFTCGDPLSATQLFYCCSACGKESVAVCCMKVSADPDPLRRFRGFRIVTIDCPYCGPFLLTTTSDKDWETLKPSLENLAWMHLEVCGRFS